MNREDMIFHAIKHVVDNEVDTQQLAMTISYTNIMHGYQKMRKNEFMKNLPFHFITVGNMYLIVDNTAVQVTMVLL